MTTVSIAGFVAARVGAAFAVRGLHRRRARGQLLNRARDLAGNVEGIVKGGVVGGVQDFARGMDIKVVKGKNSNIILGKIVAELANRHEPHEEAGKFMVKRTVDDMASNKSPNNTPYAPLKDHTKKYRKFPGKPILDQTGRLKRSVHHQVLGVNPTFTAGLTSRRFALPKETVTRISPEKFGARRVSLKARVHQGGSSGGVPPRPFMDLTRRDIAEVERIFKRFANRAVKRHTKSI